MQKLFRTKGRFFQIEDANGKQTSKIRMKGQPVVVDIYYELRQSPHSPLKVEVYGQCLFGMGQTRERIELDNGVVLTGRIYGIGSGSKPSDFVRAKLLDAEESKIALYPTEAGSSALDVDAVIVGIVSSYPLGHGACANGVARPGFPFSFRKGFPKEPKGTWSSCALQIYREHLEITFVRTSRHWRKLVNEKELQHDMIVGIRNSDKSALKWDEVNRVVWLLSYFLGWINHCSAPPFHIKGYWKGNLVYKGYNLHTNPTIPRDEFSWLPSFNPDSQRHAYADQIEELLTGFSATWVKNEEKNGIFHIALQMLRSHSKGSPRDQAPLIYLRNAFCACSILLNMLPNPSKNGGRLKIIRKSLQEIGVGDKLPVQSQDEFNYLKRECRDLWSCRHGKIKENEIGMLSRPLTNVENWLIHVDEPNNADRLLKLGGSIQLRFVEISTWLADLMILKVVGYRGKYFNRLTRKTEVVPWAK